MQRKITFLLDEDADAQGVLAAALKIDGVQYFEGRDEMSMVEQIARLETWEERCAREAVEEEGLTDPADIARHISNASADSDYLVGQDETLEGLVQSARRIRGTLKSRAEVIAEAVRVYAPVEEEDLEP